MPIYEYLCGACGHQFELTQRITADPVSECPECGKPDAKRQISATAFHLKGSGWYKTDYGSSGSTNSNSASAGTDSAKSETASKKESSDTKASSSATEKKAGAGDSKKAPAEKKKKVATKT